jgi:hypothetical protein
MTLYLYNIIQSTIFSAKDIKIEYNVKGLLFKVYQPLILIGLQRFQKPNNDIQNKRRLLSLD